MSFTLRQLFSNQLNFPSFLTYYGENPNLFPGEMNKFNKLAKIASEKKMLNLKDDAMVKSPNFDSFCRGSITFEDILDKYAAELATSLSTCSNEASVYRSAYEKMKNAPVAEPLAVEPLSANVIGQYDDTAVVAESVDDSQICESRVQAQKEEDRLELANFMQGTKDELGGFLDNDLLPKFVNIKTILSSRRGNEVVFTASDVEDLFNFASDAEKKIKEIMGGMLAIGPYIRFLRGEISEDECLTELDAMKRDYELSQEVPN